MANELAERFMHTLQQSETTSDIAPVVNLFAKDAELSNLAMTEPLQGRYSIQHFWLNYLSVFEKIHSRFTHVAECSDTIVLE